MPSNQSHLASHIWILALTRWVAAIIVANASIAGAEATSTGTKGLKFSGALDMFYQWNFNQPPPVKAPTDTALEQPAGNTRYHVFDDYHDDATISLAQVGVRKELKNMLVNFEIGFGHAVDLISPRDEVSKHLLQGYLTYTPAGQSRFSLTLGKMYTHLGFETVMTQTNWNYSGSILYAYALPFWHVGVAAKYALIPEKLVGTLFLYNENSGLYETNRSKSFGVQLQYTPSDKTALTYNTLVGPEISTDGVTHVRTLHEIIFTQTLPANWQAAVDVVYGQLTRSRVASSRNAEWFAWCAYFRWKKDRFSLSPRFEVFNDRAGAAIETATASATAIPQRLTALTLTSGWELGQGLELRLEARHDRSSAEPFLKSDGTNKGNQTTLTGAALLAF